MIAPYEVIGPTVAVGRWFANRIEADVAGNKAQRHCLAGAETLE
jgi:hypothetical protein